MRKLFGTDGIRGVANKEPMTPETMVRVGRAAAHLLRGSAQRPAIVIGKDTRLTGYMLETALTAGITSMGVDVLLVGPLPTPGIAFITRSLRADAGVVISASHNPYEDNGIKFFSGDGLKLPDAIEEKIEELIFSGEVDGIRAAPREIGKASRINDAVGRYIEFAKNTFPKGMTLKGMRVVVDCANGAAYKVSPTVLKELSAEVVMLNVQPDGMNINKGCGSMHPEGLRRAVVKHKAHIGFAHDGDADRVLFADERGEVVNGDHVLALCALDLKREGRLHEDTVVATVMSNIGLEMAMQEAGIRVVRTAVGDRYVQEEMLARRYTLGGEQSGHIIFLEHNTTGDGIVTALQVLAIMRRRGKRLSELSACMTSYPQVLINVQVRRGSVVEEVLNVQQVIRSAEARLGRTGRVLVRLSGTEPVARVMVEGRDHETVERLALEIALVIEKEMG
jgi:phosphoglucosamine mutase